MNRNSRSRNSPPGLSVFITQHPEKRNNKRCIEWRHNTAQYRPTYSPSSSRDNVTYGHPHALAFLWGGNSIKEIFQPEKSFSSAALSSYVSGPGFQSTFNNRACNYLVIISYRVGTLLFVTEMWPLLLVRPLTDGADS